MPRLVWHLAALKLHHTIKPSRLFQYHSVNLKLTRVLSSSANYTEFGL